MNAPKVENAIAAISLKTATDQIAALEARNKWQRRGARILFAICIVQAIALAVAVTLWGAGK